MKKEPWRTWKYYSLEEFERTLPEAIKIIGYQKGPTYYFYDDYIIVVSSLKRLDGSLEISKVQDMDEVIRSHRNIPYEFYL